MIAGVVMLCAAAPTTGAQPPSCGGVPATIIGTPNADVLVGTPGPDVILARGGDDSIDGRGGADLICAGGGDDFVDGGFGADTIRGGPGDDVLAGRAGPDVLIGMKGNDHLRGGGNDDRLIGGPGDDVCDGGTGTDHAGLCEEVIATESGQVPLPLLQPGPRQVALTFDDGPTSAYTPQILDVLARYRVPATFFVIGSSVNARPELLERIAAEGHSVQNHTWSHPWLTHYGNDYVEDQLVRTNRVIENATGARPNCMRPPFGAVNDRIRNVAADLGLATIRWDVDPWDWKHPGAYAVASRVLSATSGGDIVLLHDTAGPSTIDALPRIITGLRGRGYEFVSICNVPG